MDKLTDLAVTQLSNLIDAAKAELPKATEAVLWVVRVDCAQNLIIGAAVLIGSIIGGMLVYKLLFKIGFAKARKNDYTDDGFGYFMAGGIGMLLALIFGIAAFIDLINIWNWVGLYHPDLYLVHKAIDAVTSAK